MSEPTQATEPRVDFEVEDGLGRLTLVNPTRKNAITLTMADQILEYSSRIKRDRSIGAVVVDSAGGYFCSGADTRDLAVSSSEPASTEAVSRTSAVYDAFVTVGELPVPTISLVNGGAVGAGMNLALATDMMLVSPGAVLDSGFLARGIHPGGGHLRLLGRSLGYQQAAAMAMFGVALSAEQAVSLGLAWRVVDADQMLETAREICRLPIADPELARRIKTSARIELETPGVSWPAAIELERGVQMWSLGRKGSSGWARKPEKPTPGAA